ncbi:MAG TPA: RNA methyltransferase [Blastocatellia bacterium]|nr:RNA methyltransferase [Blastocatellia bacterium]
MLVEKITSRQNPLVKRFRQVRDGAQRHHIFLEGVRLVEEALSAGAHFEIVAYSPELESGGRGVALLEQLRNVPCRGAYVSKPVMEAIAATEAPQGVIALVSRPHYELDDVMGIEPQLIVIADELQDPGNLGTIIRTAEAAGATALITTRHTVDPFNIKALRASMGAALRLPVAADIGLPDVVASCQDKGVKLIATQPQKEVGLTDAAGGVKRYDAVDLTGPVGLLVGREATGASDGALAAADSLLYIPMKPGVESLNVAAATAIVLYEAARQRGFAFGTVLQ